MNWGFRFATIFVCYALSFFGLFAPLFLAIGAGPSEKIALSIVSVVMLYAWLCHFMMSLGWLNQHRVNKLWPITGTVAGVVSIIWAPLISVFKGNVPISMDAVFGSITLFGGLVSPCVLLGMYLVWFHLKPTGINLSEKNGKIVPESNIR